jgi:two-component system sensor histidine kinase YesM
MGVEQIKNRNFGFKLPETTYDEVGLLTRNFNTMVDRMDYLVNRSRDAELLQKQTDLESLQQQVTPHFLYNTLEMIMGLSSNNDMQMVNMICQSLGAMFRYNLTAREIVTVADEVKHVRNYALIVETRFENRFKIYFDVDEQAMPLGILKFIIQPFVENAVTHGFDQLTCGGVIKICIVQDSGKICIVVEDNGSSISDEALADIYSQMEVDTDVRQSLIPARNIGILNVYYRLKLRFGDDFSFDVKQRSPGTAVIISIPPSLLNNDFESDPKGG